MKSYLRSLVLFGALFLWVPLAGVRAAEKVPEKKTDVPVGYEDAAEAGAERPRREANKKQPAEKEESMEQEADVDQESEIPAGYEEAAEAGKPAKKDRRRAVVPAPKQGVIAPIKPEKQGELPEDNPQLVAIAVQMELQLKPILAAELTFAKEVCQPDEKQLAQMKALATPELKRAAREMAMQQAPNRRNWQFVMRQRPQSSDVFELFEVAAGRFVSQVFSEQVVDAYRIEQKHRRAFQDRAGAMALVAHLDTRLRLSQSQRKTLTNALQKEWKRQWNFYLQIMASNPQYFPPVPEDSVLPHLSETQIKQWKATRRNRIGVGWQNVINNRSVFREIRQEFEWFENQPKNAQGGQVEMIVVGPAIAVDAEESVEKDKEEQEE